MRLIFYNLIPLLAHLLCLLLGIWLKGGDLSMIELALDTIIAPIYLIVINHKLFAKVSVTNAVLLWIFMLVIVVIGHVIHYLHWGISTGNLMRPDSETVLILQIAVITSVIILTVGWIIVSLIKIKSV